MDQVLMREEVWKDSKSKRLTSNSSIDCPIPWYPEQAGYAVSEIALGKFFYQCGVYDISNSIYDYYYRGEYSAEVFPC